MYRRNFLLGNDDPNALVYYERVTVFFKLFVADEDGGLG